MPTRLRLLDFRLSDTPSALGICQSDLISCALAANTAERNLLHAIEQGDEGWNGTWAEMAFTVSRDQPYLTTPRGIARLEMVTACNQAIPVKNQFYEYLEFGNGRLPKLRRCCQPRAHAVYARNNVPTFVDLKPSPQGITIFCSDPTDIDGKKRILIQGQDSTGQTVYTQDTWFQPQGEFVTFDTPFASSARQWNTITGLQKDQTNGYVQVFQTDPTTGAQVLLVTMEPSETVAGYRRYFFDRLPRDCCQGLGASATVQVTAIVKLDHIPVQQDTDYFLLTNLDAISAEAQSIRYGKMDTLQAKQMSVERHKKAIQLLIGELSHYQGIDTPAIQFRPFGSARLTRSHIRIGMT